jgi:hypothetical protein
MSRKNSGNNGIRLYDSDGRYQCHLELDKAETMKAAGTHEDVYEHICGKPSCSGCSKMRYLGIRKRSFHKENPNTSQASITFDDMQALVGITGGEIGAPAKLAQVFAAEDKVEAWPTTGDWRAVRVRPRISAEARL